MRRLLAISAAVASSRYYAKRCLVALLEALAKNMMMIKDETFHEILQFLDQVRQRWATNKVYM